MLELINLSKDYGKLRAVSSYNLTVEEGEIKGLIGPNGSGKTTIFNLITGILKPTAGEIVFSGKRITGRPPHVVAGMGIGRTFQLTSVLSEMTVLQNVIIACHLKTGLNLFQQFWRSKKSRKKEGEIEEKSIGLLELMGILNEKDTVAGELPEGTQRILAITNALASDPRLLMLDEPVAGLNTAEKVMVMDKVKALRDQGMTVFLVEHDMKTIMTTCDRISVIHFGEKIAEGTPEEVSNDQRTIEAYLGSGVTYRA
jgi:branched-chain amino acid transport system ATP-binding protein